MTGPQSINGTFTDGRTIVLDRAIVPMPGRVRVVVESIDDVTPRMTLWDFLDELGRRQSERGHVPRTREEIDRALAEERRSWGD